MDCPVCKSERLSMMDRQGIEIDYCAECHGVWLEGGELEGMVEGSAVELAAAARVSAPAWTAPPQLSGRQTKYDRGGHRPRHDDRSAGGHRRRSFLQELFD